MIWGWIKFKDKFWLTSEFKDCGNLVRRSTYFLSHFTVIKSTPVLFYDKQNKLKHHQVCYPCLPKATTMKTERNEKSSMVNIHVATLQPDFDWIDFWFVMSLAWCLCLSSNRFRFSLRLHCCRCRGFGQTRITYLMLQFILFIIAENWGTCNDWETSQKIGAPSDQFPPSLNSEVSQNLSLNLIQPQIIFVSTALVQVNTLLAQAVSVNFGRQS